MSLFQCDKCGVGENTALTSGYLTGIYDPEEMTTKGLNPEGKYCSLCFDGEWHGKFPRVIYPLGMMETDYQGNLRKKLVG